jgi:hypothetical protein
MTASKEAIKVLKKVLMEAYCYIQTAAIIAMFVTDFL